MRLKIDVHQHLWSEQQPFFLAVGFFETHRDWLGPSSVRDALYSIPPANLPDVPDTRRDMAAYNASARSLEQGVGTLALLSHSMGKHGGNRAHTELRPVGALKLRN